MKKVFFIALVAVFGLTNAAFAQFKAGTLVLGGSMSYGKNDNFLHGGYGFAVHNQTTIILSPRIGTFLADDFEVGIQPSYMRHSYEGDGYYSPSGSSDMIALAPYARKYISLNDWAGFYFQGGAGLGWGRRGGTDLSKSDFRTRAFILGVSPGIAIKIGERVGIDFQANLIEYQRQTHGMKNNYADTKSDSIESFTVGPNLSNLSLGISFFL